MNTPFILNSALNSMQIYDAIEERINKAKAVLTCLLTAQKDANTLTISQLYDTLWVVDDYVNMAQQLVDELYKHLIH